MLRRRAARAAVHNTSIVVHRHAPDPRRQAQLESEAYEAASRRVNRHILKEEPEQKKYKSLFVPIHQCP